MTAHKNDTAIDTGNKNWRLLRFGYISALSLWTVAMIFNVLLLFYTHTLSLYPQQGKLGFTDFVHFYVAGQITMSADRHSLYSWEVQKHFLENLSHCKIEGEDFYTQYMPLAFLLMVPYSLLAIDPAHILFDCVNLVVGLAGCWALGKHFNWTKTPMFYLTLLGALASSPSWNTWLLGQISWLYIGLICFYIVNLLNKKNLQAGLFLALTSIKPQYAVFLAMPAVALKRYRLIAFAIASEILLFLICVSVFGLKAMMGYPAALNQCESTFNSIKMHEMYGLASFLSFFLSRSVTYYSGVILFLLSALCLTIFALYLSVRKAKFSINWLLATVLIAGILFSPHSHSHDCLFVAVAALLTLPNYTEQEKHSSLSLKIWYWTMCLMPLITWLAFWTYRIGIPGNILLSMSFLVLLFCAILQIRKADEGLV